jgi:hypothetical protein
VAINVSQGEKLKMDFLSDSSGGGMRQFADLAL